MSLDSPSSCIWNHRSKKTSTKNFTFSRQAYSPLKIDFWENQTWRWMEDDFLFLNIGWFLGSILIFQGVSESNEVMLSDVWSEIYEEYKWIRTLQLTNKRRAKQLVRQIWDQWVATRYMSNVSHGLLQNNPYEAQAKDIPWAICQSPLN